MRSGGYVEAKDGDVRMRRRRVAEENAARASRVYCSTDILDAVHSFDLFGDSKTFVDLPMLADPETILSAFEEVNSRDRDSVKGFLETHFGKLDEELEEWMPTDWICVPRKLARLAEPWRSWALDLNERWKDLGRVVSEKARIHPARSSLLAPKFPFVAPGGRFREPYYWDSYWIVDGLLACDMFETAKHIIDNLLAYVDDFGFVPNGGRCYYLNRSQPPLLSEMVVAFIDAAVDSQQTTSLVDDLVSRALPLLEAEYEWWMRKGGGRVVVVGGRGNNYVLNRYYTNAQTPRPESYKEDLVTAAKIPPEKRPQLYGDLAAAAESGWDFSVRWMSRKEDSTWSLANTVATNVIPVDLNAIMLRFERNLAALHEFRSGESDAGVPDRWRAARRAARLDVLQNDDTCSSSGSIKYTAAANARLRAVEAILWRPDLGVWRDFHLGGDDKSRDVFDRRGAFASDFSMLWAGASDDDDDEAQRAIVDRLRRSGLLQPGGILASLVETGQQWDAPNAWPPLQLLIHKGLRRLRVKEAANLANVTSKIWIDANFAAWNSTGNMYEKYDAYNPGAEGGGGEYTPQFGFGWTNGVVLSLLTDDDSYCENTPR